MALEVGQDKEGIIIKEMAADGDFRDPLGPLNRKRHGPFLIHDIHGAEGPAVVLYGLAVLLSRIPVAGIEGIGINENGILKRRLVLNQVFHPGTRNDIGSVLFSGMELYCNFAGDEAIDPLINLLKAFRRKIPCEIHDGLVSCSLLIGDILFPVLSRNCICLDFHVSHNVSSLDLYI